MTKRLPAPSLPGWLAEQVPFERYVIEVDGGVNIHVMEHGAGRPVVMFHGNPTWGYLYRKVVGELADGPFRLIMPDLPGLGFSDRVPGDEFTLANQVRWMGDLVGRLDLDDAIFVVQDWGGPIGLHAGSQHPGLVTGLVVMNTIGGPPKPGFKPTTFHRIFSTAAVGGLATRLGLIERNMRLAQGDRTSITRRVRDSYLYPLKVGGNEAVVSFVRMVPDSMEHPSVPVLDEVGEFVAGYDGPAAIVWGRNDPVLGKVLRRVSRSLPQAKATVTDAGHFLQEEVPVDIAAAVRSVARL